jgi:hypothetical protein
VDPQEGGVITAAPAADPSPPVETAPKPRWRRWAVTVAGPALIVASVLAVLHGFWWNPKLTSQQVDLLAFWLPRYCAMGKAIAAFHIPTWLPNQFGGAPFASDPQSGWLYLPAMALFGPLSGSLLGCARALGLLLVIHPLLAGLGMYWFLRHERVGRAAATLGGLTLGVGMAGSSVALSIPFSGMLAWTTLCLVGASGFLHARTGLGRLGWLAFTGLAWSQLAGAHLTNGVAVGTGVLLLYVAARSIVQVRSGERTGRTALLLGAGLFVALPLLSAAVLIPRLDLLPRTSIGQGYAALARLGTDLSGAPNAPPFGEGAVGPWWGTSFARGPGGYLGVLAILLWPFGLLSRKWRAPSLAFAAAGLVGFVLNLDVLVRTDWIRSAALKLPFGELWLRSPFRFRYVLVLVFAVLAGYGLQAWLDRRGEAAANVRPPGRRRAWWRDWAPIAAVVVVFGLLPLLVGARPVQTLAFGIGLLWAIPLLALAARGVRWASVALCVLAAVELVAAGIIAQGGPLPRRPLLAVPTDGLRTSFPAFHAPFIEPTDYLTPGPIGRAMIQAGGDGRYLTLVPAIAAGDQRGFLSFQQPRDWPTYENGRSILFGLDEVQGYNPVQLLRYWSLVRRLDPVPIYYNSANFQTLEPSVLRLFGTEWLILPAGADAPAGAERVAGEGDYVLYRLPDPQTRASVVFAPSIASDGREALEAVIDPSFDPARTVVLEYPGSPPSFPPLPPDAEGTATYREVTPEDVRVDVTATAPGWLVVRNAWDENWRATVDGQEVPVRRVDYLMQGISITAGEHEVRLTYEDSAIGRGLLVSAVAWALLGLAALWLWVRRLRWDVAPVPVEVGSPPPGRADVGL